jgi:hypothetical protein
LSLKCPFCGKEYYHDSKMCKTCEEKSIINARALENYTYVHNEYTTAFGCKKPDKFRIKIASEPKYSDFCQKMDNNWNCDPRFRTHNLIILKSEVTKLRVSKELNILDSKILEKDKISVYDSYE